MTKGTRAFRIIISILLGITMLWTAYISYAFIYYAKYMHEEDQNERYGLYIAGVDVTPANADDILGDGTVYYNKKLNRLVFNNVNINCEGSAIYSEIDLTVELIGDNKFVCGGKDLTYAVYASDVSLKKSLAIRGDGTLEILIEDDSCTGNAGIIAGELWLASDVSITLADASDQSEGISCSYLNLDKGNTLTVRAGSAENSTGIFVRGDVHIEPDSVMDIQGSTSTQGSWGIECTGILSTGENSIIRSESGSDHAGIVCYSAVLDHGATFECEIAAIDGIQDMKEN